MMISDTTNSGPFWAGDVPAVGIILDLDEPLTDFDQVETTWDGVAYGDAVEVEPDDLTVTLPWPVEPDGFTAGEHKLGVKAVQITPPGAVLRLGSVRVFVQDDDGWHTLESAREEWPDAPRVDASLWDFLAVARDQVIEFGPVLPDDATIPPTWRTAQLMQAKALYQKNKTDQDDTLNSGTYGVTIYPMDKTIRSIIRPKRGFPSALTAP